MKRLQALLGEAVSFAVAAIVVAAVLATMLRLLNGSTRPEDVKDLVLTQQQQLAQILEIAGRIEGQVSASQGWRKSVSESLTAAQAERAELRALVNRVRDECARARGGGGR